MRSSRNRYAVIGNPVEHSRSPEIHAMFAEQTGEAIVYERLLAPVDGFRAAVDRFRAEGGAGLNVTLPFKQQAYDYAKRCSVRVAVCGSANTLAFHEHDVFAENTDGPGLVNDIEKRCGVDLRARRVLLLGAGGAARGVVQPLLLAGVKQLVIANRTFERAQALVADLKVRLELGLRGYVSASRLEDVGDGWDVIVNATAAGLEGATPELPRHAWTETLLALDMVYGAAPTPFMIAAMHGGCERIEDGLGMLVAQAAESFGIWRSVVPRAQPVYDAMRARLAAGR